jgi:hypothetical protein
MASRRGLDTGALQWRVEKAMKETQVKVLVLPGRMISISHKSPLLPYQVEQTHGTST